MYTYKDNDKQLMLKEITNYFEDEFDLDLGIIAAENVLDFFTKSIGGKVYNIALDDVRKFYKPMLLTFKRITLPSIRIPDKKMIE